MARGLASEGIVNRESLNSIQKSLNEFNLLIHASGRLFQIGRVNSTYGVSPIPSLPVV